MFDLKIKKIKSLVTSLSLVKGENLFNKGFIKHVYYKAKYKIINDTRIAIYDFYLKNSIYKDPFMSFNVNEEDTITETSSNFKFNEVEMMPYIVACVMLYEYQDNLLKSDTVKYNIQKEKVVNEFVKQEEKIYKEKYEANRRLELEAIEPFLKELNKNDYIPLQNKVHVECNLEFDFHNYFLKLKVGIDKTYVVQNILKFVRAIMDRETLSYGKSFSFNHNIENFDDDAKKILEFLMHEVGYGYRPNSSLVSISSNGIDRIFELMKGKIIYLTKNDIYSDYVNYYDNLKQNDAHNTPYYVNLSDREISTSLDKKYNLKLDQNVEYILYGDKFDYLLEKRNIYKIKYRNPNERELIRLLFDRNGQSFRYIEDVFKDNIYPRFSKIIKVDDHLKESIKLNEYKIESYFDYQNNELLLDTKYLCNDTFVNRSELENINFTLQLYDNYISSLGFKDNKVSDTKQIATFLLSDLSKLKEVSDVFLSNNIKALKVKKATKMHSHISYMEGMLSISFEESEFSDKELEKIIHSLKKGVKYVKLSKDTIIEVDDDLASKLLNTVNEFNLDITKLKDEQTVPLYQSLKLLDKDIEIVDYNVNDDLKNLLHDIANYKKAKFPFPSHLESVARPYQKEAYQWMKTLTKYNFCGILADDMGLGKTFEVISLLCSDKTEKPSLIVCPKSLCYNWKNEFELWGPEFNVTNVIGLGGERKAIINNIDNNKRNVYISSYDSLRNDIELYKDVNFRYVILDEAQSIKNHETKKSQSVRLINSELRFVLTGTPIENRVLDLWSIFDFLMPSYLGNYFSFRSEYENSIVMDDNDALNRLVKKITPFVLRRTKEKVLKDLPNKIETIQIASMEKEQKKIYDALLKQVRDMLTSNDNKNSKIDILASLTRLREVCVDPNLYVDNYKGKSCKLDLLMEIVPKYISEGHKIVIFSQFASIFPSISKLLNENNIKHFILTGQTEALKRVEMATLFNELDSDEKVFLVSLKAGGTGLNLVGADIVIHLDPWWNYAVEEQATDRLHRIGQTKAVNVIKMVVENSIEQKVIELQKIKKDIASKIIQNDTDNIEKMSVDDIAFLLE